MAINWLVVIGDKPVSTVTSWTVDVCPYFTIPSYKAMDVFQKIRAQPFF